MADIVPFGRKMHPPGPDDAVCPRCTSYYGFDTAAMSVVLTIGGDRQGEAWKGGREVRVCARCWRRGEWEPLA